MSDGERRSSPSPPPPGPMGTGSYPAVAGPVPEDKSSRALRIALEGRRQIGHPPVEATRDPGSGMWMVLAEVRRDVARVLAVLEAADATAASGKSVAARVAWRIVETLIPLGIGVFLLWLSGWHR